MNLQNPNVLLELIGAVCVAVALSILFRRFPSSGVASSLIVHLLATADIVPATQFGTLRFSLTDLVTASLAGAVLLSTTTSVRLHRGLLVMLALMGIAFLRGLDRFSIDTVGNAARLVGELLIAALFGYACVGQSRIEQVRRLWQYPTALLTLLAILFLARNGFGTYGDEGSRSLNSPQALVVSVGALMALGSPASRRGTVGALVALAVVLTSQQRTVWAATAVGLASIALASRSALEPGRRRLAYSIMGATALGVPLALLAGPSGFRSSVAAAADTVSVSSGTFGWRIDGWLDLLRRFHTYPGFDQVLGQPMGVGFARNVFGTQVAYSPHNMYLTVLISLGFAGLCSLLLVYGAALRGTKTTALYPVVWAIGAYSIGYQITPPTAVLLGVALSGGVAGLRSRIDPAVDQ